MTKKIEMYVAAALFNGRETSFNLELAERLKEEGYGINLPQNDGFEFGNLERALEDFSGEIGKEGIGLAVQDIIYYLDMGLLIPRSDVVLANFDEPLDEGVIVEVSYARLMGKFVVGFRTDVRSPYGVVEGRFGGMHFFPAFQSDVFIRHSFYSRTREEREKQMNSLVQKIHKTIQEQRPNLYKKKFPEDYVKLNPYISSILENAELLFEGIENISSEKGIREVVRRYVNNREKLRKFAPKIIGINE